VGVDFSVRRGHFFGDGRVNVGGGGKKGKNLQILDLQRLASLLILVIAGTIMLGGRIF